MLNQIDLTNFDLSANLANDSAPAQNITKTRVFQTSVPEEILARDGYIVLSSTPPKLLNAFIDADLSTYPDVPTMVRLSRFVDMGNKTDEVNALQPNVWIDRFLTRVGELKEIAHDENLRFSRLSCRAASKFVEGLGSAAMPSTFLVGNGNLRIVWENELHEQVALQFIGLNQVQYVFFQRTDGQLDPIMGTKGASKILGFIDRVGLRHVMQ